MEKRRDESKWLLECKDASDRRQLLAKLFEAERDRLRRLVIVRLDRRLQSRVDPSDILQEAFLQAASRLEEFLRASDLPFFLWLRRITQQTVVDMHRRHLEAKARDARRDIHISVARSPEAPSKTLAALLVS